MGIMKRFISLIASSVLASALQSNIPQHTNYNLYVQQRNTITQSDIEVLCNIIYCINQTTCKEILQLHDYTLGKQQIQNIEGLVRILDKIIVIAYNQMSNGKQHDEKVYYSSLALKNLLESLLNTKYMQVTGGFSKNLTDNFDSIEYGKKVHEIHELLHA